MKSIKVIVIGFILAIALVAWPVEYTQNITAGTDFLLGGVLAAWLGIRRWKGARKEYEDDVRRYTGTTMMKVVWIEESVVERWEHQEDGSDRPRRETYYLPTYQYTVKWHDLSVLEPSIAVRQARSWGRRWSDTMTRISLNALLKTRTRRTSFRFGDVLRSFRFGWSVRSVSFVRFYGFGLRTTYVNVTGLTVNRLPFTLFRFPFSVRPSDP